VLHRLPQFQFGKGGADVEARGAEPLLQIHLPQPFAGAVIAGADGHGDLCREVAPWAGRAGHADLILSSKWLRPLE
jgi:hypothetical protein